MAMELGAFTPFLYFARAREVIWDIFEEETGARVTHSFGRVGGMAKPPTADFKEMVRAGVPRVIALIAEGEKLLLKNRIFLDRVEGIGAHRRRGRAGPGLDGHLPALHRRPLRRAQVAPVPASTTAFDFDVPVGTTGDNYDRFMCRSEEIRQSCAHPRAGARPDARPGPDQHRRSAHRAPPKEEVYTTIEGTIQHFKIVMEGIKVPAGECYSYTEAGNGELGFYLVSDGSGTPYRVRIRPPCFASVQGLKQLITGLMIPDVVPTFGSLNMIGGECDH